MKKSARDIAREMYPLIYEAGEDIEGASMMSPRQVLTIICEKEGFDLKKATTGINKPLHTVMDDLEKYLEDKYAELDKS